MHPEVEFLGIPVANLNRTLGKNSICLPCIVVVSSPKVRFIVQEMRATENQHAKTSRFSVKSDSTSPILYFFIQSTGGVTRDPFYLFDISAAAEFLRDTSKISAFEPKIFPFCRFDYFIFPLPHSVLIPTSLLPTTYSYLFQYPWYRWIPTILISNLLYFYIPIVTPQHTNCMY
jgi:hypothetical protein